MQLQNQIDSPFPSPQKVDLDCRSELISSPIDAHFILEDPPARKKAKESKKEKVKLELKKDKVKLESKGDKKKSKIAKEDKKSQKSAVGDKGQQKISKWLSPPQSKVNKEPEIISNECSPLKKVKLNGELKKTLFDSPQWDTPMRIPLKPQQNHWEEVEGESPKEEDATVDVSKATNLLRSPIKPSTPIRNYSMSEEVEIPKMFPDPGKFGLSFYDKLKSRFHDL